MKHTKKLARQIAAGAMSAALLFTGTNLGSANSTVKAADNDYYQALALSLYFFDANACGSDVDEGPLTWRGDCHVEDEKALLSNATNFDSSYTSLVDPDGDGMVDVGGGYHDAGDHIKFNLTMGFGIGSLALSEYMNPGIYEKAGCKDHMLAITKRNADYLMKTTFLDASGNVATICHVVADGGVDHSMMTPPEEQHYDRATYWLTASKNNSAVCGEMASALAGAAYLFQDSDPAYAATCIKYAKAILDFGKKNVGNEGGGLSSFYPTDAMYQDEMALADAWLWIVGEGSKPTLTPSNGQYNGVYDCYRYTWDKVWQGYAAIMYKATGDTVFANELIYEINNAGGLTTGKYNGDGWGAARYNCALQMSGLAVANGDKSNQYAEASKWQMDYIMGDNPTGYSFLIGYGSKWPTHYHHRAANPGDLSNNPESKYCLYGALVGGVDASGNYEDHSDRYQYTEPALDYNGCFALACAGLADLYGGSDKGAASIVSSASEIKSDYSFGGGTVTPTEPTTTEPTEPTTTEPTEPTTTEPTEPTATEPTEPTATEPTGSVEPSEEKASVSENTGAEGNTYWTIDISNATKVAVKVKTNSNDTESNGCFNAPGGWAPVDWVATPNGDGTFTVEYTNTNNASSIDFYVWWPTTATIVEAVKTVAGLSTEPTQPTQDTTTQEPTSSNSDVTMYGDVNCDNTVDILDVIALNRYLLGSKSLSETGSKNADVDDSKQIDSTDSLNILKRVVNLIQQSDFPIK